MENVQTENKKWTTKKIVNTVVNAVLWIFLVFAAMTTVIALATTASDDKVPNIFGYSFLNVITESMDGEEMKKGDLIIVKLLSEEEKNEIKKGDVITYLDSAHDNEVTTHRVEEVYTLDGKLTSVKTKGDNNAMADTTPRTRSSILGIYTGKNLRGVGTAYGFLQSSTGFLVCVVIPLLLFFIYEVFIVVKNVVELKNKDKKVITEEDEELIKQQAIAEYLRQQEEEKAKKADPEPEQTAEPEKPETKEEN